MPNCGSTQGSRSTSATRAVRGSAAPTRTPTDCSASISRRAPISASTAPTTWPLLPLPSMAGHARRLTGRPRQKSSISCYSRANQTVLRRRVEPGQYTSLAFGRKLRESGIAAHKGLQSLSRPRQCWDNAVAESFFATLKEELVYRLVLSDRDAARRAIFEFIEVFYNRNRLHSTLGYLTPAEYEEQRQKSVE